MVCEDGRDRTGGNGRVSVAGPHYPGGGDELLCLSLCGVVTCDSRKKHSASGGKGLLQNPFVIVPTFHRGVIPTIERCGTDICRENVLKGLCPGRRLPQERDGPASHALNAQVEVHKRVVRKSALRRNIGGERAPEPPLGMKSTWIRAPRNRIGRGERTQWWPIRIYWRRGCTTSTALSRAPWRRREAGSRIIGRVP